ncbi:MAG: ATP phosphoribosyltransferase regulatory subunit [Pseudomonadota bacterium]
MLESLLQHLRRAAPDPVSVNILQPVDPFLETAGEEMRRRIFITADNGGRPLCLRPEFTIPICLSHMERNRTARYAYGGTVFRQQRAGHAEFRQAGLEDLGRKDSVQADADCVADLFAALAHLKLTNVTLVLGDQSLFGAVVEDLGLPTALADRLTRAFGKPDIIERMIGSMESDTPVAQPVTEAEKLAAAGERAKLIAHVEALMATASIAPKSGRAPAHIADRMIARQTEARFRLDADHAAMLRAYLALSCPLADAPALLSAFASTHGVNFGDGLTNFTKRIQALKSLDVHLDCMTYRASFGRNLDYYSGLLFDAYSGAINVAGGGRYDHLCTLLGSKSPVPAVGFSIQLDRVVEALKEEANR